MNFLKGFVDGFLTTDLEGNSVKSRHSYEQDEQDNDSDPYNRTDLSQNRNLSNNNTYINNSLSQLSDLYKNERDNCQNGLIVRYGEGCVQQLSQLLKSNYDTILSLSHQYQNNLLAFKELNNRMESVATEQLKLKNENNNLFEQLNLLNSENFNLKSQLTHANITIKSNENHISSLNDVLRDNKSTFENMKNRCGEFYKFKTEIEDLKKKLSLAESHISMLKKERDEYWSDPNRVLTDDDYKKRLSQALERQDRAIAVAKVMASQTTNHFKPEKDEYNDFSNKQLENETLNELKLQIDKLEDENSHLKEINDRLHNMYADLNKNLKEVKTTYLKESVESLTSMFPTRTVPIQLVFIQPTGVLDLDLDPNTLNKYSQSSETESYQQYEQEHQHYQQQTQTPYLQTQQQTQQMQTPYLQAQQHLQQPHVQQSDLQYLQQSKQQQELLHTGPSFSTVQSSSYPGLHHTQDLTSTSTTYHFKDKSDLTHKKQSPKMNFRSKVIQLVTGLDGTPKSSKSNKVDNLLDLDSPKRDTTNYSHEENQVLKEVATKEVFKREVVKEVRDEVNELAKSVKSTSWNTDWDMFDEEEVVDKGDMNNDYVTNESSTNKVLETKVEKTPMVLPTDDSFDFILEEENRLSQNDFKDDEVMNVDNTNKEREQHLQTQTVQQPLQHTHQQSESNHTISSGFSDFNTHDHFDGYEYDDLLKSIKGEEENVDVELEHKDNKYNNTNLNVKADTEYEYTDQNTGMEETDVNKDKNNNSKIKKGWDMDFDDEMFDFNG